MQKAALPGFRDFYPEQLAQRAFIMNVWREVARRFAFVEYDGPPLEPLELYTRKSGDEIVGQLYNFVDKGGRDVSLRPEMTPTVARMVAAKANALRNPVRWFSMPQLFRYERTQKGRLREHYQLNVDIFGEGGIAADAELLAVALEIMREFGLTPDDVVARVSDRRLLRALLARIGVREEQVGDVFGVIDKIDRQPREISAEKLAEAGLSTDAIDELFALVAGEGETGPARYGHASTERIRARYGDDAAVAERLDEFDRYFEHLSKLGVREWARLDLTIVRGLAYYTGIVFELFDARGEFRAICGGGRYDDLLQALGGVSMPALGFGMGDVVLGELLRAREHLNVLPTQPDFWIAVDAESALGQVMTVATLLRRSRAAVEYALRPMSVSKQRKAAYKAGAAYFVTLTPDFPTSRALDVQPLSPALAGGDAGGSAAEGLLAAGTMTIDALLEQVARNPRVLLSTY